MDNLGINPMVYNNTPVEHRGKELVWQTAFEFLGEKKAHPTFGLDEVILVWFSKSLQNWKALYTTTLPDGRYYEVTHNGNMGETYVDVYRKTHQFVDAPNGRPNG